MNTISLTTVQAVVARALSEGIHERGRVERAATLVTLGAVEYVDGFEYLVRSQTGDGSAYIVTPNGCTCVDSQRYPARSCKHNIAVRIVLQAELDERRAAEQAARARFSADAVALAYARAIGFGRRVA